MPTLLYQSLDIQPQTRQEGAGCETIFTAAWKCTFSKDLRIYGLRNVVQALLESASVALERV